MSAGSIGAAPERLPAPGGPGSIARAIPLRRLVEAVAYALFGLFIFFTCFTFLRPSPYDFTAIPAMAIWLLLGLRVHRGAIVFLTLLVLYHVGLLAALIPYFDEPEPTLWTFQSVYLMLTCIFFVMFFTDEAARRFDFAANAYLASSLFAAICGIVSYFLPAGILFTMDGRAAGVFEDPNVLGSFLVFGALIGFRRLITGEVRHRLVTAAVMLVILAGLFLSFSRGAWAALVIGLLFTAFFTFRSSASRIRRRMIGLGAVALVAFGSLLAGLLTVPEIADTFADRFTLTKDYDEGEMGRFGNQLRSIPMLIEQPGGFGPLRFRLRFGLEPHNSYIGGFANGGWPGGFAFVGLVLATGFVGVRLCLTPSPFQSRAQMAVPAALMFFMQAFQIDIDHWRHVYIVLGMIWGLECARLKWLEHAGRPGRAGGPARPVLNGNRDGAAPRRAPSEICA